MRTNSQSLQPEELKQFIIDKAQADTTYKHRLLSDAKVVFEEELGQKLPANFEIQALQQSMKKIYLLLPIEQNELAGNQVLSEEELEAVAGGGALKAILTFGLTFGLGITGVST